MQIHGRERARAHKHTCFTGTQTSDTDIHPATCKTNLVASGAVVGLSRSGARDEIARSNASNSWEDSREDSRRRRSFPSSTVFSLSFDSVCAGGGGAARVIFEGKIFTFSFDSVCVGGGGRVFFEGEIFLQPSSTLKSTWLKADWSWSRTGFSGWATGPRTSSTVYVSWKARVMPSGLVMWCTPVHTYMYEHVCVHVTCICSTYALRMSELSI
jgi:hypothetical protein